MPRLFVACVMLQRVPPDIRILTPGLRFFSSSKVRRPRAAAVAAATRPAAPAPTTITSQLDSVAGGRLDIYWFVAGNVLVRSSAASEPK